MSNLVVVVQCRYWTGEREIIDVCDSLTVQQACVLMEKSFGVRFEYDGVHQQSGRAGEGCQSILFNGGSTRIWMFINNGDYMSEQICTWMQFVDLVHDKVFAAAGDFV